MHVLVTEAHFGDSERLVRRLRALDIRVTTCHDLVGYCRTLQPSHQCPLDALTGAVDLVVDVRGPDEELTAREYGAVCAVRAMRPLWIVGAAGDAQPGVPAALRDVASAVTENEFVTTCQRRARTVTSACLGWPPLR